MNATMQWPPLPDHWRGLAAAALDESDLLQRLRADPDIAEARQLPYMLKTSPPRIELFLQTTIGNHAIFTIEVKPAGRGFRAIGWRAAKPGER